MNGHLKDSPHILFLGWAIWLAFHSNSPSQLKNVGGRNENEVTKEGSLVIALFGLIILTAFIPIFVPGFIYG